MPKETPKTLNLLEASAAPKSTWDNIYDWVFKIGRYIIVAVEAVVILAFVSRFILDRRNNDLKEEIEGRIGILSAQREMESEIRSVQKTLTNISKMTNAQNSMSSKLEGILSSLPGGVSLDSINIDLDSASLTCRAPSYELVEETEGNFRSQTDIYDNVQTSLTKSGSSGAEVEFSLDITFKSDEAAVVPVTPTEEEE